MSVQVNRVKRGSGRASQRPEHACCKPLGEDGSQEQRLRCTCPTDVPHPTRPRLEVYIGAAEGKRELAGKARRSIDPLWVRGRDLNYGRLAAVALES
jgi:hypothetical protein